MSFALSKRSLWRLNSVHEDLHRVISRCAADWPNDGTRFVVTEGRRSLARQRQLLAIGASQTLKSRHLCGMAADLAVIMEHEARWDWPLYEGLGERMKLAAQKEAVAVEWGGDWKTLRDGPHFQLSKELYPDALDLQTQADAQSAAKPTG